MTDEYNRGYTDGVVEAQNRIAEALEEAQPSTIGHESLEAVVRSLGLPFLGSRDYISIEGYLNVPEFVGRILAAVGEPKCEHGYTLSDLCQWVEDSANLPIDAEQHREES
jgi:hypothetical protein